MTEVKAAISNHLSATENLETVPFRLVLEASPDGFIILSSIRDAAGKITDFQIEYINPVAARGVNCKREELLGQYLLCLFPDCKTSGIFAHYVGVAETGISSTFETFYDSKHLAGWFRNVVVKLNDRIAIYSSNITDVYDELRLRKQAELALQQQEQHLRIALETAKLGSWEHDLTTGVLTCSDQYKANFGLSLDAEFTHETLFAALHPDDRPLVQSTIERAIAERIDYQVEERYYHPDGSLHWLIDRGQLVYDSQGTPMRMVGVTLDITERQQFEQSLQAANQRIAHILESITDAFVAFDHDWRYTYVNHEAARMLGRSPQALLGEHWQEAFPTVNQENSVIVQQFEQAMAEQTTVRFEAFSDTINRWLDVSLFPSPEGLAMYFRDISERIRAEEELRQREAELRLLTNAVPVLISFVDTEQRYRFNNQKYEEWFGNPATEVYGKHLWEVLGDEAYATIRPYVEQVLAGQEVTFESKIPYKEGGTRFISATYVPRVDQQGNVEGFVALVSDITQRQQAQEIIRQSEAFNRQILESSEDCIKVLDLDGSLLYMSPGGHKLLGVNEINSLSGHSWVQFWPEADQPAAQAALNKAMTVGVGTFQGYCPTLADEPKWLDVKVTPIKCADGKVERLLCISRDITARKQAEQALCRSEERYRYLAESIPQLVWTANAEGVLIDINQRWYNFTGVTLAQAQTVGWQAVVHPDDVPILSQQWAIAQQDDTYYQAEGRMRRVDGVYRWHLHQAIPLKNEHGQVIKWFGTATDIEDQKQLEQQRVRLLQQEQAGREQAEAANRIKDEFLAVLSHELRSPLNPILGWSKLLQTAKLDEARTKQALTTIERNAQLQAELIEDLLDVSRILQGKLSLTSHPINLASTIKAALETVQLAAEAKSIRIDANLDAKVGLVLGDSTRLQQVMWNLLSNAVKFTPPGGRVEVRLSQVENQAQITVSDTGKGISAKFLPYVFDYFRQADSATTRKFGGLGLGLAIVHHLVDLHGGTIQVESQGEGMGATFTLKLPLMPTQPTVDQDLQLSTPSLGLHGIQVLVVDDDTDTRDFVAFLLEQAGARVIIATSALEALQVFTQSPPDILLSDIGMPEMDGYMLMRQIRALPLEQGGQIPAIALTAYAGEIDEKQALKVGFQRHISKPLEPDNLVRAIVNLIADRDC
jgi:PAS domain S-box-containing protein